MVARAHRDGTRAESATRGFVTHASPSWRIAGETVMPRRPCERREARL